ncbi:MAG: UDP-N-acetylmuramate--L-alanine ligase [Candidatus Levyibacteriota bacterium]|nr:MAG: UDP-N-acetylmuramate--L-alanine ligase [Candidatus Levybacteria bacterium]
MKKIRSIHFVGIKGVGMTPLAIIAKEARFIVSGCDIADEFITDESLKKAGIMPLIGFSKHHLEDIDMVITTGAHGGFDNPEVIHAKQIKIPVWTQGEAVAEFMKGDLFNRKQIGISVTGSHGKTTTTAMIATVLKEAGKDPSYVVGTGFVPSLGSCGHYGEGKYFVAEADEYANEPTYDKTSKFLLQHPEILIFTNIEHDHPDLYPTVDDVRESFLEFANNLSNSGMLIAYGADIQTEKLLKRYTGKVITFGFTKNCDFVISRISGSGEQTFFWLSRQGSLLGEFCLSIPGDHNVLNATAAIIAGLECGIAIDVLKQAIKKFVGSKRRFEYVGTLPSGAVLYDDYAHHPTEIKKTLAAFKKRFPKSKLVCIFQPHTYSRTKSLFEDFISSFQSADTIIISNIYSSLREKADLTISSKLLVDRIKLFHKDVWFLPELVDVIKYVQGQQYGKDTVVVTMGAGDIYKIASSLLASSV